VATREPNNAATVEDLKDQVASLRHDLGDVTHTLKQMADGELHGAAARAKAAAGRASDAARTAAHVAKDEAEEIVSGSRRVIADRPLTAAAVAAAVGFLAGALYSRR
jgi:ElaB/YqjD/DUF883 family membrane-anchored ribosome-binding protein